MSVTTVTTIKSICKPPNVKCLNADNSYSNEILELWSDVHFVQNSSLDKTTAKTQTIWCNSLIRAENKPIYYRQFESRRPSKPAKRTPEFQYFYRNI